jgi:hypothetical protein
MLQKSDEVTKMLRTSVQGVGKKFFYKFLFLVVSTPLMFY